MIKRLACLVWLTLPSTVLANIDARECEAQVIDFLRTDINCTLKISPDNIKYLSEASNGLLKSASCLVPLKFNKADVYGAWIKTNAVNLPNFTIGCNVKDAEGKELKLTTQVKPSCLQKNKKWLCNINMSNTAGLGFLGQIFENYINTNLELKAEMSQFLADPNAFNKKPPPKSVNKRHTKQSPKQSSKPAPKPAPKTSKPPEPKVQKSPPTQNSG